MDIVTSAFVLLSQCTVQNEVNVLFHCKDMFVASEAYVCLWLAKAYVVPACMYGCQV